MFKINWLSKNIIALGIVSLLSDLGHEMAIVLLPSFLISLGGSAASLGLIEGIANASVSFMKLGSGWYSDYLGKRKIFATIGYFLASLGVVALYTAYSWYQVLVWHVLSRLGKGVREPARDALLADSSDPLFYGRVFGFHRAMDNTGAIIGPLISYALLGFLSIRTLFLIAFIPLFCAVLIVIFFVKDIIHKHTPMLFGASLHEMPRNFKLFLLAFGVFNLGNYATTLLILRASELLQINNSFTFATQLSILLYVLHNLVYSIGSLPAGTIADAVGRKKLLVAGFLLTSLTSIGFMLATANTILLTLLFVLSGLSIAVVDTLKRALSAQLMPAHIRGTSYGLLATLEGITNLFSSAIVGFLWSYISPLAGFGYSAILCAAGALLLSQIKEK